MTSAPRYQAMSSISISSGDSMLRSRRISLAFSFPKESLLDLGTLFCFLCSWEFVSELLGFFNVRKEAAEILFRKRVQFVELHSQRG